MARIDMMKVGLMTPDLLEKSFRKHPVWEVWARMSIDNLMFAFDPCPGCRDRTVNIIGVGRPIKAWCSCEGREGCGAMFRMTDSQIETLNEYLWDHDAGFGLLDRGIETIALVMGMYVDKTVKDWIGENPDFTEAWSKVQEVYLHKSFGLTEINLS